MIGPRIPSSIRRYSPIEMISLIHDGDILLASGNSPISRIIRMETDSDFSHIAIIFTQFDIPMVYESVESRGVSCVGFRHYTDDWKGSGKPYPGRIFVARDTRLRPDRDDHRLQKMKAFAIKQLGHSYDRDQLAKILFRLRFGIGKMDDDAEWICSEFDEAIRLAGGFKTIRTIPTISMPKDLPSMDCIEMIGEVVLNGGAKPNQSD